MRAGFKESAGQPPSQHQRPTLILFIDMDQILQHHILLLLRPPPRGIPLCVHLNEPDYILRTSTTDINRNSLTILRYWSILLLYHFLLLSSTLDSMYAPEINMRHVAFQGPEHHPFSAIAAFGSGHVTPVSGSSSGIHGNERVSKLVVDGPEFRKFSLSSLPTPPKSHSFCNHCHPPETKGRPRKIESMHCFRIKIKFRFPDVAVAHVQVTSFVGFVFRGEGEPTKGMCAWQIILPIYRRREGQEDVLF